MKVNLAYAERQLRHWTHKVAELRLTSNASNAKEKTEGGEKLPPAPPTREGEEEKKGGGGGDARARMIAKVSSYNAEIGGNIDAEYFVDYYGERLPKNWKSRIRNWLKEDKSSGRLTPAAKAKAAPRVFTAADWALCAERCRHCDGKGCARGIACPPDQDPNHPHPPEECAKFRAK